MIFISFSLLILNSAGIYPQDSLIKQFESQQPLPKNPSNQFEYYIKNISDSALISQSRYCDSIKKANAILLNNYNDSLNFYIDSLKIAHKDSLPQTDIESLYNLGRELKFKLLAYSDSLTLNIGYGSSKFKNVLQNTIDSFIRLVISKKRISMKNEFDNYNEIIDSLVNDCIDSVNNYTDYIDDKASDFYDSAKDTLLSLAENFIDKINDEREGQLDSINAKKDSLDMEYDRATRLELSLDNNSHNSYRGRDNGVKQYYISPELNFIHRSGISINFSTYWLNKAVQHFDETDLGIQYEYEINDNFGFDISYTHSWFGNNSYLSKSDLNNNIETAILFDFFNFELSPDFSIDFSTKKELSLFLNLSYNYELENICGMRKLTVEPTFSYIFGEQNKDLVNSRKKKVKGIVKTITTIINKNLSGVLDYEFTLPIKLDYKMIIIMPYTSLDIPVNIIDASYSKPFVSFGLELIFSFR